MSSHILEFICKIIICSSSHILESIYKAYDLTFFKKMNHNRTYVIL
ncbi:hypothetical protein LEP1GSC024_0120 [Leptospira noguchii str. 2001034031]|uniref:Uncharacterized protein n=1 Tax=Leptospira noguchii str. 2001034031 TaxID=1193053 RepID=M6Y505_9LEPT|nr:hypothetical protein LEP1GSC024_0120 [Leptospira noguchii str. 2001034031]